MADNKHEHGNMKIDDQKKTFDGFIRWTTNAVIAIIVFLVFLYLVAG